ncbi:hypothetical protein [Oryza sativa Japonica Group]|uniref:Uncharacterized protein n=1 Tax=Oryza sativa subsp. japonica TaxID=39947 RepID=Q5ZDU0_ORYSJ|nr:hypothetical protein [Oryza sativa Japonica Group]
MTTVTNVGENWKKGLAKVLDHLDSIRGKLSDLDNQQEAHHIAIQRLERAGRERHQHPGDRDADGDRDSDGRHDTTSSVGQSSAQVASRTVCRLTPPEMDERRRKGLCFNCDDPYTRVDEKSALGRWCRNCVGAD